MALALRFRAIKLEHFADDARGDPNLAALAQKLHVTAPPEIDRLYPQRRPARVTATTRRGAFTLQVDEALGSRLVPLDDDGLRAKFHGLVAPVLGEGRAAEMAQRVWAIDEVDDVASLIADMQKLP